MTRTQEPPAFAIKLMKFLRNFGFARGLVRSENLPARQADPEPLELYSWEGCAHSRRVRETLSELDLDYLNRSCPIGSQRNRSALERIGGKVQVPYLIDPNTGVAMYESERIVEYLERTYSSSSAAVYGWVA